MKKILYFTIITITYLLSYSYGFSGQNFSGLNINNILFSGENNIDFNIKDNNITGKAILEFMNKQKNIINQIYQDTNLMILLNIDDAKKQIENLSKQLYSLADQFEKVSKKKKRIDKNYQELLSGIRLIIQDIKDTNKSISLRLTRITIYSNRIIKLKKEIKDLQQDINLTKKAFIKYTRFLYKLSNEIYDKDLEIDTIKLLFKNEENISLTLSKEDILKMLSVKLKNLIKQLEEKQKKLNYIIEKLTYLKNKYRNELKVYNKELELLKQQRKYMVQLLKILKLDKEEFDKKYNQLFYSKNILHKQLLAISHGVAKKIKQDKNLNKSLKLLLQSDDKNPEEENFFSWPLRKINKISTYFKDPEYEKKYGAPHLAIDIPTPQGTTIYAPADGIVYKVFESKGPGLTWMIIVHKGGYISVYLHLSEVLVKEGEFVKRGQPIAKSGGKPGTKGAGLLTSGPHLHFEIIKYGQHIDPLTVLDLSLINFPPEKLPKKYRLKYLKDKLYKNIDLSKIKPMKGNTEYERRINFLKLYGVGPYRNIELWEAASKNKKIDIDLGICIAFAETSLGKYFAKNSKWNVGNVGNNDRGNRVAFKTPIDGARAIYDTLNNKYLKNIYTLNKLSRYGSKNGPIYASDSKNWQRNVMKCLKMIKGYPIPEDFFFRLP